MERISAYCCNTFYNLFSKSGVQNIGSYLHNYITLKLVLMFVSVYMHAVIQDFGWGYWLNSKSTIKSKFQSIPVKPLGCLEDPLAGFFSQDIPIMLKFGQYSAKPSYRENNKFG